MTIAGSARGGLQQISEPYVHKATKNHLLSKEG
jgi:hypothetical protein